MRTNTQNTADVLDRVITEDSVDIPEVTDFTAWRPVSERKLQGVKKVPVTLLLDEDVAGWVNAHQGGAWLISVNSRLRKVMEHAQKR